jgi:hypothetical protein
MSKKTAINQKVTSKDKNREELRQQYFAGNYAIVVEYRHLFDIWSLYLKGISHFQLGHFNRSLVYFMLVAHKKSSLEKWKGYILAILLRSKLISYLLHRVFPVARLIGKSNFMSFKVVNLNNLKKSADIQFHSISKLQPVIWDKRVSHTINSLSKRRNLEPLQTGYLTINDGVIRANSDWIQLPKWVLNQGDLLSQNLNDLDFTRTNEEIYASPYLYVTRPSDLNEKIIETGIFLAGPCATEFGHWMITLLPRIGILDGEGVSLDIPLLVPKGLPPQHLKYLKLVTDRRVIFLEDTYFYKVKRLLTVIDPFRCPLSPPNYSNFNLFCPISPDVVDFYRSRGPKILSGKPKKVYLTRKNSTWRKIINEVELIEALDRRGFEIVSIEEFEPTAQISFFSNHNLVVGAFGSAFLPMMLSESHSHSIGIVNQISNEGYFGEYLSRVGHFTSFFEANPVSNLPRHANFSLNVDSFLSFLDKTIVDWERNRIYE